MVRRVKAYLNNMRVITDEDKLHSLSLECEPSGSAPNSVPVRKRHPSPTLSTTSSTSSASEGKKGIAGTKFGEFRLFFVHFAVKPLSFTLFKGLT
jgi:Rap guanine nucleotide exchange factor 2